MEQWIISLAVLGFVCLVRVPKALHRYFVAEFWAVLSYAAILAFKPETSRLYIADFMVMESLILVTAFGLMLESVREYHYRDIAFDVALAGGLVTAALTVWGRKLGLYDWIAVVEGFLYVLAAIPTGLAASQLVGKDRRLAKSLLVLWLAQSAYEYGFTLHLWQADWMRVNEWFPLILGSGGSLWLAWGWGDSSG